MKTKVCKKCGQEKELDEFYNRKDSKDGLSYECKACRSKRQKDFCSNPKNKQALKDKRVLYNQDPNVQARQKQYRDDPINKNRKKIMNAIYRSTAEYKERYRLYHKKWRADPIKNAKRKAQQKKYRCNKLIINNNYKLSMALRIRLSCALKNNQKVGSAIRDLGCSIEELKSYLESKFQEGMSWENYGRKKGIKCWEIDHVVPISNFNLEDPEQFKKACHYTNLQPLWAEDNLKKSNR
jgi:hypothetical protein